MILLELEIRETIILFKHRSVLQKKKQLYVGKLLSQINPDS